MSALRNLAWVFGVHVYIWSGMGWYEFKKKKVLLYSWAQTCVLWFTYDAPLIAHPSRTNKYHQWLTQPLLESRLFINALPFCGDESGCTIYDV